MKPLYFIYFFIYYAFKVIESGYAIAWQILRGSKGNDGMLIEYRPGLKKDWHVVLLFNLISMTPGSMSIDINETNDSILVHLLNRSDRNNFLKVTGKIESLLAKAL
ncbi:Na+/H+ antiporter subunit E [Marinilabilia rubra]|uniref:Multiple resistance and pH homeostasis system, subunit E n=1 Tax=Marinilabilia rubra TaxID=2162893 RepID=A0A2U2BCH8_9BACT|nr:Na+/H+ antiporter subunit E [Marinilabilia rubra]PWE00776.1 multiple resistance and pH homeostasis system, subunit E [Marinilabilia rubra]